MGTSISDNLREGFKDREYADAYARAFLDSSIATQIKVLREQREWTQEKLADEASMKQPRIAVMEDVNYSSWSVRTLWRLARAFHLRLKVSFEEFGTLIQEMEGFGRESLERLPLESDPVVTSVEPTFVNRINWPEGSAYGLAVINDLSAKSGFWNAIPFEQHNKSGQGVLYYQSKLNTSRESFGEALFNWRPDFWKNYHVVLEGYSGLHGVQPIERIQ